MFGKLTSNNIPYNEPIVMITILVLTILSIILMSTITYYKKWKYLWTEWFTSVDHKKIGIMYIIIASLMFVRGFADAIMMRAHQAISSSGHIGFLTPHHYDQIVTAHGVIMIIFMATPFIIGLMNLIVPLQIGARDVAFPFLNSLSFWLFMVGVILINLSLGIGEFAQTGWAAYPPLSHKTYSPGVGVDYWIWSIQISGIGTTLTGINFFTTILYMRTQDMPMMKMPVFTWTALCTNTLILAAFPILTATILLLTLDRYIGTHFFTNDLGGNMMLYINLFWAWGHPEVYILVLPAFGIFSEIVATFSKKQIFGYTSLVWATIAITFLSFCVWLHHFFTMGSGANVNAFFGIMTMIIAIPTGVKVFNWIFTMYKGQITFNSAMLWTVGFIITFSIGGMTGVLLAIPGIDFVLHNSLFLIAHFHNVIIGGVIFGCFAGLTYWFPKAFGCCLNEKWGKFAYWLWITGFYISFMPLYILGFMGMTRRLNQNIDHSFHELLTVAAGGVIIIALGIVSQIIQIIISIYHYDKNKDTTGDPWNGRTLEWSTPSPPPLYNFPIIPQAHNTIDSFWYIKNNKQTLYKTNIYQPIHMPKNTNAGIIISIFSLIFGFSMIWNIWWLAIFSLFFAITTYIIYTFSQTKTFHLSTKEIQKIEKNILCIKLHE
ncbi:cytochrome o ubiquinol oxidase subunit I [Blochmannia endosymbiont of Polyrhachis (Hedomyrma) turneri]|uniref:cytochrome o ubiquinol oxidase subunit I n=1 Tax=Blochmannia endosymbiont of Polyrhachis (Hedomyrma) turneri TaxID=1505596 RepID=UPI00061A58CD|nr:cytochrome o ubiquinol oxidase subunit I [Blochmannia endosymbiont of Polyrhachis (Hedomyrma) turneri]AKC59814.1 Ubiquinol oxidase subunit 1 [Blochmannia endosymbiont of Polyrhachis (Hedomyrma) turneri]